MADLQTALRNADAAGDTEAARRIAQMIKEQQAAPQQEPLLELQDLLARQAKGEQGLQPTITQLRQQTGQPDSGETAQLEGPTPSAQFAQDIIGGVEGAATLATGIPATIAGGIVGLADAANPFAPEGAGAARVKQVQEALTFQPRTESGRQALAPVQELGETVEAGKQFLGDDALAATGSPLIATIAHTLPDATLSLLGVRNIGGVKTPQQAAQLKSLKDISGKASSPQSATKQRIGKLIQEGVTDVETAKFKLIKSIDDGAPKVVKDKIAIKSIKQGFDAGVVAAIKGSTQADKSKMLKMVDIMEKGKKNKNFAVLNRPADVAGDTLMDRFRSISKANKEAGAELNNVAKSLKKEKVDQSPAVNQFIDDLDEIGVSLDDSLNPIFQGSNIEGVTAAENVIRKIVKRMKETKAPNAFDVHRLKKFIDEQVTFGKNAEGLAGTTEYILKDLRRNLDGILDKKFAEYNRVNTVYSETRGAIDAFQDVAGKKTNLSGVNADKAVGTLMRRVMSNAQSRVRLLDSINEIEETARKHGGGKQLKIEGQALGKDDLLTQILFVDELDAVFGPVARTSFQGQIKQAVIPRTATDIGVKAAEKIIEKARGINETEALKAIKQLLKETNR